MVLPPSAAAAAVPAVLLPLLLLLASHVAGGQAVELHAPVMHRVGSCRNTG
jgi:hypothetical protein